jgi:hypothetical protein
MSFADTAYDGDEDEDLDMLPCSMPVTFVDITEMWRQQKIIEEFDAWLAEKKKKEVLPIKGFWELWKGIVGGSAFTIISIAGEFRYHRSNKYYKLLTKYKESHFVNDDFNEMNKFILSSYPCSDHCNVCRPYSEEWHERKLRNNLISSFLKRYKASFDTELIVSTPYKEWTNYEKAIRPFSRNTMDRFTVFINWCRVFDIPRDIKMLLAAFVTPPFSFGRRWIDAIIKLEQNVRLVNNCIIAIAYKLKRMLISTKIEWFRNDCQHNVFEIEWFRNFDRYAPPYFNNGHRADPAKYSFSDFNNDCRHFKGDRQFIEIQTLESWSNLITRDHNEIAYASSCSSDNNRYSLSDGSVPDEMPMSL